MISSARLDDKKKLNIFLHYKIPAFYNFFAFKNLAYKVKIKVQTTINQHLKINQFYINKFKYLN